MIYLCGERITKKNEIMNQTDSIRNSIIDNLITISNLDYLKAIYKIVENSTLSIDKLNIGVEQRMMLQLSEDDIQNNRVITETEMNKTDLKWLKEL
jgi:hypothetical protein